jgi:hypothetical protein
VVSFGYFQQNGQTRLKKNKEVAWGGERTRVLSNSCIFSFSTTLPLSHSGSPPNTFCQNYYIHFFRGLLWLFSTKRPKKSTNRWKFVQSGHPERDVTQEPSLVYAYVYPLKSVKFANGKKKLYEYQNWKCSLGESCLSRTKTSFCCKKRF